MIGSNHLQESEYYEDLSQEELRFILFFLECVYNGIDNPEKKQFYRKKISYVNTLIKEIN